MRYLSKEEIAITTRFLFISMAIVVIEQDLRHIEDGPFKIKEPYVQQLHQMNLVARRERKQLRKQMNEKNLQVIRGERTRFFSTFILIAEEKQEEKSYFNPAIRKHVETILRELIQVANHSSGVSTDH